jgi:hypothetical protein
MDITLRLHRIGSNLSSAHKLAGKVISGFIITISGIPQALANNYSRRNSTRSSAELIVFFFSDTAVGTITQFHAAQMKTSDASIVHR